MQKVYDMIFAWLFALLIVLVISVLLIPIIILIDTASNRYELQLRGLAKACIETHEEKLLRIKLRMLFFTFYFYPLQYKSRSKGKKAIGKDTRIKRTRKRWKTISFRQGIRFVKSFRVQKFLIDFDTGDCLLNAKIYPVATFLNYYGSGCHVNFEGRNRLMLQLQNRPIRMIQSFINL
ncbi:hypothetical protein FK220_000190 [Flavobacteriaceae bacterium TP-CH-4]|uniref:Uncharacterized protein n=1 Tax=Pelagihabitans pacificus TaxID=2696054 RepID=A0A967EBZ2_9FLAO|nr:hypothetical protein [Pelagihabitans pacificus]NHF57738.1 hypothetical protein [Pelagihabitans pacificus]